MPNIPNTIVRALLELLDRAISTLPGLLSALVILFLTRYAVQVALRVVNETGKPTIESTSLQLLLNKVCRIGYRCLDNWCFARLCLGVSWF